MPDFAEEALLVLMQLAYRRSEAEAMIAETLAASPNIADAEALLAAGVPRQEPPRGGIVMATILRLGAVR